MELSHPVFHSTTRPVPVNRPPKFGAVIIDEKTNTVSLDPMNKKWLHGDVIFFPVSGSATKIGGSSAVAELEQELKEFFKATTFDAAKYHELVERGKGHLKEYFASIVNNPEAPAPRFEKFLRMFKNPITTASPIMNGSASWVLVYNPPSIALDLTA